MLDALGFGPTRRIVPAPEYCQNVTILLVWPDFPLAIVSLLHVIGIGALPDV